MAHKHQRLICSECMTGFTITAEEQELAAFKGLTKTPSRCPECHASREARRKAQLVEPVVTRKRRY